MKKTLFNKLTFLFAGVLAVVFLGGCSFSWPGLAGTSADTIKIGSQNTTEQQIMANMIQQMIQHYDKDTPTTILNNLGSGNVSFQAQKRGDTDMTAIRYNGTDYQTVLDLSGETDPKIVNDQVFKLMQSRYHMTYFPSYGFADTYQFMVSQKYAKANNLKTISDMKRVAPDMKVGIDQIWANRRGDGYSAFQNTYGFSFGHVYPMQIGLVYDALEAGKMDAVLGYSTDGRIRSYNLKLLQDDKHFFPPYKASVVVNDAALKAHPKLKGILSRLNGKINLTTMQELNYQVDNNLVEPAVAAQQFLEKHNYFEKGAD
ncbi:osmoprotectant ABC transporter substrate-binding protein [Schleiferilactobacillus harbinensis]|jgi:osmoprotectant transport system substrate-binding protein|uniref:Osmoprotectant ABC transporter substrate-binding protein n=1 Tax=Schleiferilactobacillus harbinensis TaxID=304207 RepID=A0A5P8M6M8_9LACO|nr:osmoprotectant ABC transporter substrate-binding protein [Schleiferilactobacillus harbinensis]MCI1851899.1 osmoprotectant ABC transporter substrate-binding protein [Schleiferilactobacillus harbinensis]QFR24162.1 osmoprotectant ABC transporter substrate-binding protein [Schleiferilactobacillus harbinensis]